MSLNNCHSTDALLCGTFVPKRRYSSDASDELDTKK